MVEKKSMNKKTVKYGDKFGLDKNRKKLGAQTDEKKGTYNPGKDFTITRIVMSESKKKYDMHDADSGEMKRGKIGIAQIDGLTSDGTPFKVYSPNAPIVESCEQILADSDFGADSEGYLSTPCEIHEVIEGTGEKNRNYLAFA